MDEQGDAGVVEQVQGLFRRRVRGHYDDGVGVEGRGGEVGVVHEGDVGEHGVACCEVQL